MTGSKQQPQEHCGHECVCGQLCATRARQEGKPCEPGYLHWSGCNYDTRQQHSAGDGDAPMYLPEEMPFDPDDIPQKKFVIVDDELRQFFDAWMFSSKDVRILHKINDDVRNRIISIGFTSGVTCTRCHKQKSSGYYLCEQCYHENAAAIKAEAQREERKKTAEEIAYVIQREWMCDLAEICYICECVGNGNTDPFESLRRGEQE